jgi:O-antigen ligase
MSRVALELIAEHPILGMGLGSFRPLAFTVQPFGGLKTPHFGEFPSTHNSFLTVGAELGLPGLAIYLILFAAAVLYAVRAERSSSGEVQALHRACIGALMAYAVGALFLDSHEYLSLCTVFYFLIALGSASPGANDGPETSCPPR